MKNGLFRFYFLFMFLSMGLFSCENRVTGHDRQFQEKVMDKAIEEQQMKKESAKPKRRFRHYSRSANLC